MNIFDLFFTAGIFVQLIMGGLLIASIYCWAVIIEKILMFKMVRSANAAFDRMFWNSDSFDDITKTLNGQSDAPKGKIFLSAMVQWQHFTPDPAEKIARVERIMHNTVQKEMEELENRLPVLATIASAAPFIGLLGTVWGIMSSFTAIAEMKQATLAVVAPGIAEALFATALGLLAAIPATIGYNRLILKADKLQFEMDNFIEDMVGIVSRAVDKEKNKSL